VVRKRLAPSRGEPDQPVAYPAWEALNEEAEELQKVFPLTTKNITKILSNL